MTVIVGVGMNAELVLKMDWLGMLNETDYVIDHDVVEERNIRRQIYNEEEIGMFKVDALALKCMTKFKRVKEKLQDFSLRRTLSWTILDSGERTVIMATDNVSVRKFLNDEICQIAENIIVIDIGCNYETKMSHILISYGCIYEQVYGKEFWNFDKIDPNRCIEHDKRNVIGMNSMQKSLLLNILIKSGCNSLGNSTLISLLN